MLVTQFKPAHQAVIAMGPTGRKLDTISSLAGRLWKVSRE
jgi:hypothetical protein